MKTLEQIAAELQGYDPKALGAAQVNEFLARLVEPVTDVEDVGIFQSLGRVLARDVSLAEEPGTSSIQNVLRGCVDAVADDGHPGLALVRVRVGDAMLLARLTKRSAASLGVAPGRTLWVQSTVTLLRAAPGRC